MADQYILGIDVGGTKTHALVTTFDGKIVSVASGEGANWENIGLENAVSSVHTIALEALHSSSLTFSDIAATTLAMAGADWDEDSQLLHQRLVKKGFPDNSRVVNDALAALYAGAEDGIGCVSVAGTGGKVIGRDSKNMFSSMGGILGEASGAHQLSYEILKEAVHAYNGRIDKSELYFEIIGELTELEFFRRLMREGFDPFPGYAPRVFEYAAKGDNLARNAVITTASEHAEDVIAIARKLKLDGPLVVVCSGGLHTSKSELFTTVFQNRVSQAFENVRFNVLDVPPVVGAVAHAAESIGILRSGFIQVLQSQSLNRKADFLHAS
jgi:N-acetylglucosamine kinase-like BadF-type ATPase